MKKMIENKVNQTSNDANDPNADMPTMPFDEPMEDDQDENHSPLLFKFRKYLRELAGSSKWAALRDRSLCHFCEDPLPDDPWGKKSTCYHRFKDLANLFGSHKLYACLLQGVSQYHDL